MPHGLARPPASISAWSNAGLVAVAQDPFLELGRVLDDAAAGGNRGITAMPSSARRARRRDHVVERGALDMSDVYTCSAMAGRSAKDSILAAVRGITSIENASSASESV